MPLFDKIKVKVIIEKKSTLKHTFSKFGVCSKAWHASFSQTMGLPITLFTSWHSGFYSVHINNLIESHLQLAHNVKVKGIGFNLHSTKNLNPSNLSPSSKILLPSTLHASNCHNSLFWEYPRYEQFYNPYHSLHCHSNHCQNISHYNQSEYVYLSHYFYSFYCRKSVLVYHATPFCYNGTGVYLVNPERKQETKLVVTIVYRYTCTKRRLKVWKSNGKKTKWLGAN